MTSAPITEQRILAIDPNSRGFGFVVLEGPTRLVNWGGRHVGPKNRASLHAASELIALYQSQILIVEDVNAKACWKRTRQRKLIAALERYARENGLTVRRVSRHRVRRFRMAHGMTNKDQMARFIASRLPELADSVPRERKRWMSEHPGMAVFDAAALALAFFSRHESRLPGISGEQAA